MGDPVELVPEVWVEIALDDQWLAAFRLHDAAGDLEVAELRVFPREPDHTNPGRWSAETERLGLRAAVPQGGLTARTVRGVRFGSLRSFTTAALKRVQEASGDDPTGFLARHFPVFGSGAEIRRSGEWNDRELARLAARYVTLVGTGARAVAELAQEWHRSERAIRAALTKARRRELLTETPRRKAGGTLTPKARELLDEATNG